MLPTFGDIRSLERKIQPKKILPYTENKGEKSSAYKALWEHSGESHSFCASVTQHWCRENWTEMVVQPCCFLCISAVQIGGLSWCFLSKLSSLGRQADALHFLTLLASHVLPRSGAGIEFIARQHCYLKPVNFLDGAHEHLCLCERGYENICEWIKSVGVFTECRLWKQAFTERDSCEKDYL